MSLNMASPSKNRHGVYICRVAVPKELRPIVKRSELKESLKTKDPHEARLRFPAVYSKFRTLIDNAKKQAAGETVLSAVQITSIADTWLKEKIDELEREGAFRDWYYWIEEPVENGTTLRQPECPLQSALADAEKQGQQKLDELVVEAFKDDLSQLVARCCPGLRTESREYINLARQLASRVGLLVHHLSEREMGKYSTPEVESKVEATAEAPSMTLSETWDCYVAKLSRELGEQAARRRYEDYRAAVFGLIDFVGDLPINRVTADHLRSYRDLLFEAPSRPKKALKARPLAEQARIAKEQGLKTLSFETVSNRMIHLSALFTSALDIPGSGLTINPVSSEIIPNRRRRRKEFVRREYSRDELSKVFHGGWFAESDYEERLRFGAAGVWLPVISYYTGARREEIAALDVTDVEQVADIWCFRIRPNGADKRTKTGHARDIPIHSDLMALGLLDYAKSLPRTGKLWPDLNSSERGKYGDSLQRKWSVYVREQGVPPSTKPFHGFRHAFATSLRERGVDTSIIAALDGHSLKGQTNEYGSFSPQALKRAIEHLPRVPAYELVRIRVSEYRIGDEVEKRGGDAH
ncbi:site-specific integrase [Marinobacter salinus]|nr:site-specific integrase [Marinobacter salinus]